MSHFASTLTLLGPSPACQREVAPLEGTLERRETRVSREVGVDPLPEPVHLGWRIGRGDLIHHPLYRVGGRDRGKWQWDLRPRGTGDFRGAPVEQRLQLGVLRVVAPLLTRKIPKLGELAEIFEVRDRCADELETTGSVARHVGVKCNARARPRQAKPRGLPPAGLERTLRYRRRAQDSNL